MCNRFFNRRCFFPIEVAAKSCVFLVVPSRSFGKAETQIVFSDPQDMPAPKRGVGLSFLPGMGDQHQVHVWENTYIMQPKAFHQNSVADACWSTPESRSWGVKVTLIQPTFCGRKMDVPKFWLKSVGIFGSVLVGIRSSFQWFVCLCGSLWKICHHKKGITSCVCQGEGVIQNAERIMFKLTV